MRFKVLWVEDNAEADLFHFLAPVNVDGRFDVDIAVNATEACARLNSICYDVIIMDSRVPPGNNTLWKERDAEIQKREAYPIVRLGLEILKLALDPNSAHPILPENREEKKYCIFSIDPKRELLMSEENKLLDVFQYEQKRAEMPRSVLLSVILRSLRSRGIAV